MMTAV